MAYSDTDILEILDLKHNEGLTAANVARRLGISRSAVCGVINRYNAAPDRFDGTMPRRWWARSASGSAS